MRGAIPQAICDKRPRSWEMRSWTAHREEVGMYSCGLVLSLKSAHVYVGDGEGRRVKRGVISIHGRAADLHSRRDQACREAGAFRAPLPRSARSETRRGPTGRRRRARTPPPSSPPRAPAAAQRSAARTPGSRWRGRVITHENGS